MNELLSDKDKRDDFRSSADRVSELVEELNAINLNEAAERALLRHRLTSRISVMWPRISVLQNLSVKPPEKMDHN